VYTPLADSVWPEPLPASAGRPQADLPPTPVNVRTHAHAGGLGAGTGVRAAAGRAGRTVRPAQSVRLLT
jgi:hypothetical protein